MKKTMDLTKEQKEFIDSAWQRLTFMEMSYRMELKSVYKVHKYCKEKGYHKKDKKKLDDRQKEFIRTNYLKMTEGEIARTLGITKFFVQEFKRSESLAKYAYNRKDKVETGVKEMFFNVDSRESWVA